MTITKTGRLLLAAALMLLMLLQAAAPALADQGGGVLAVKDGMLQPILQFSDPRAADYSNEGSDILRYCVYVETDHDTDNDGLMVSAILVDYREDGTPFKAYMTKDRLDATLPVKTVGSFEQGGGLMEGDILQFVPSTTYSKCVTFGWTDLCNPGLGYDSSEYTKSTDLEAGREYDYTFYMLPTAYTLAPGHRLQLVITAWDPYRAFLDEDYVLDPTLPTQYSQFNYSFVIDNASLRFLAPVA